MVSLVFVAAFAGCAADGIKDVDGISPGSAVKAKFAYLFTTVAQGDVWLPNPDDGMITRIDGVSGEIRAEIDLHQPGTGDHPQPQSLTTDPDGDVWASLLTAPAAVRIDPETNEVVERVPVRGRPYGIAATETDLWLTDFEAGVVLRVDRTNGREVARITDVGSPTAIVVAADAVWVADHRGGDIARIDPATNRVVDRVDLLGSLEGMAAADDALWVATTSGEAVLRVDLDTMGSESVELGMPVYGLAVGEDGVWVTTGPAEGCDETNSAVVLIDPQTREERGRVPLACAFAISAAPGGLVVAGTDGTEPTVVTLRWEG